ncbi:MAG: hypothetical protein NZ519_10785 [Bacteroidia bacterium]|nr:hypothetical protein [Bacteroidia bacterium]
MNLSKLLIKLKIDKVLLYKLGICITTLLAVFFYLDFDEIYHLPPQSTHHWRQSDGFSMALNYYQFNLSLFKPEMHNILGGNGRAVGEFPILYYITGQLFRVFGVSYAVFRIVHFLPLVLSLLYVAYFLLKKVNMPLITVLSIVMLLFACPLISYYGLNYLPNVPSLGFFFIGCSMLLDYLFFDNSSKKVPSKLIWSSVFVCLSALLKPTTVTSYCAFIGIVFLSWLFPRFAPYIRQEKKIPILLSFLVILAVSVLWFYYAAYYKKINNATYFLIDILPYWKIKNQELLKFINERLQTLWLPAIAHKYIIRLSIMLAVFLVIISLIKRHYSILVFFISGLLLDTLVFYLWYEAYADHDYYLINFYGFAFVVFILSLYYLNSYQLVNIYVPKIKNAIYFFILVLVTIGLTQSKKILEERYAPNSPWKENFNTHFYEPELKAYIKSIGLTPKTKVVSIPDLSVNSTLCLLNLKGITQLYYGYQWSHDLSSLSSTAKQLGIKYLVVCSPEWTVREDFKAIKLKPIGAYKSISFYEFID